METLETYVQKEKARKEEEARPVADEDSAEEDGEEGEDEGEGASGGGTAALPQPVDD
jgi:hypothetical protein